MTIFQKMLFVPVLSLIFYASFLFYSYTEHQNNSLKITSFSDEYIPLLQVANENSLLFTQLRTVLKDAVLASELKWLDSSQPLIDAIQQNFNRLELHSNIINANQLTQTKSDFTVYHTNAIELARQGILDKSSLMNETELIAVVEEFHNRSQKNFTQLRYHIETAFSEEIVGTNDSFNQVLVIGGLLSFASIAFLVLVTLYISFSTRKGVYEIVDRMKAFAQGETDFKQRIYRSQRDELGYLIHWFNKLSDKLEHGYLKVEKISITDQLTQLNNRNRTDAYFPQALQEAQNHRTPLAAVILDIDKFKSINDTYGHIIGDDVLCGLAHILKNNIQPNHFLARWGGEEFVIIMPNTLAEEAEEAMNSLRETIAHSRFTDVGNITVSFGIAMANEDDNTKSIMERADKGLYKAKENGRNCVVILN